MGFNATGGGSYTITRAGGDTTSLLTLAGTAASFSLANSAGNNTIAVPLLLQKNLSVTAATGSSLTLSGTIGDNGAGHSLALSGDGALILTGSNNYTGGTSVGGGVLALRQQHGVAVRHGALRGGRRDGLFGRGGRRLREPGRQHRRRRSHAGRRPRVSTARWCPSRARWPCCWRRPLADWPCGGRGEGRRAVRSTAFRRKGRLKPGLQTEDRLKPGLQTEGRLKPGRQTPYGILPWQEDIG